MFERVTGDRASEEPVSMRADSSPNQLGGAANACPCGEEGEHCTPGGSQQARGSGPSRPTFAAPPLSLKSLMMVISRAQVGAATELNTKFLQVDAANACPCG